MNFLKYLQYVPLVIQLIGFIQSAQKTYREAGSGAQKLAWVSTKFSELVSQFEMSGLLTPKLAQALRDGASAIISVIVQFMKAADGDVIVPPGTPSAE